jgi:hypothetical protein
MLCVSVSDTAVQTPRCASMTPPLCALASDTSIVSHRCASMTPRRVDTIVADTAAVRLGVSHRRCESPLHVYDTTVAMTPPLHVIVSDTVVADTVAVRCWRLTPSPLCVTAPDTAVAMTPPLVNSD